MVIGDGRAEFVEEILAGIGHSHMQGLHMPYVPCDSLAITHGAKTATPLSIPTAWRVVGDGSSVSRSRWIDANHCPASTGRG